MKKLSSSLKAKVGKSIIEYVDKMQAKYVKFKYSTCRAIKLSATSKYSYQNIFRESVILFNWVALQASCMPWNDDLKTLHNFLKNYSITYRNIPLKSVYDEHQQRFIPEVYKSYNPSIYDDTCWAPKNFQSEIVIHNQDRSLTDEEYEALSDKQKTHQISGETCSNRLFDATNNSILKLNSFKMTDYVMDTFDLPEKHSDGIGNSCRKKQGVPQFSKLSKFTTTQNTKERRLITQEAFLGPLKRAEKTKGTKAFSATSKTTDSQFKYELKDMILVLDIDNGRRSTGILKAFLDEKLPVRPQMIIREKEWVPVKKGNASALIFFSFPLTASERKEIITGFRNFFAKEYNMFSIDKNATGVGYFKNPFLIESDKVRRETLFLRADNENYMIPAYEDKNKILNFFRNYNKTNNMFSVEFEKYLDFHPEEIKTKCYTDVLNSFKAASLQKPEKRVTTYNNILAQYVPNGTRHQQLSYEIPIILLQYYNHTGIEYLKTATPELILDSELQLTNEENSKYLGISLFEAFWKSIEARYDLVSNNEITRDIVYKWMYKIVSNDIKNVNEDNLDFYNSLWYQHNIMTRYHISNIAEILDIDKQEIEITLCPTDIPKSIRNKIIRTSYSYGAAQRGADTNYIYSIFNTLKTYTDSFNKLKDASIACIIDQYKTSNNILNATKFLQDILVSDTISKYYKVKSTKLHEEFKQVLVNTEFRRNKNVKIYNSTHHQKALNIFIHMCTVEAKICLGIVDYNNKQLYENSWGLRCNNNILRHGLSLYRHSEFVSRLIAQDSQLENSLQLASLELARKLIDISIEPATNREKLSQFINYMKNIYNIDFNSGITLVKLISQELLYETDISLTDVLMNKIMKEGFIGVINETVEEFCPEYTDVLTVYRSSSKTTDIILNIIKNAINFINTSPTANDVRRVLYRLNDSALWACNSIIEKAKNAKELEILNINENQLRSILYKLSYNYIEGKIKIFFNTAKTRTFKTVISNVINKVLEGNFIPRPIVKDIRDIIYRYALSPTVSMTN